MVKLRVYTDLGLIADIQARSVRAPDRDVPGGITCWVEGSTEHYFLNGAYLHSLPWIPVLAEEEKV